jgi:hypothetical protein
VDGVTRRRSLASLALAVSLVACGVGCRADDFGFAVALELRFSPALTDAEVQSVNTLRFKASGDETYDRWVALGRSASRVERTVYVPAAGSRSISIEVTAIANNGATVAVGTVGPLSLVAGNTVRATLELEPATGIVDLGGGDGATPSDASVPDGGATLLFSDEFDGDLAKWSTYGTGSWSVSGGEARQSDDTAALSFIYAPSTSTFTDFHLVSKMRMYMTSPAGGALELTFRVTTTPSLKQYFCNWEPDSGNFIIMYSMGVATTVLAQTTVNLSLVSGYSDVMPVTMHADVQGTKIHCFLEEIPSADLTVLDSQFAVGSVGAKVYKIAGAYDYVRVYDKQP